VQIHLLITACIDVNNFIIWVINQPLGKPLVKEQTNPLASLLGGFGFGFAGKTTAGVNTVKPFYLFSLMVWQNKLVFLFR
jgi:hypothetical protein